MPLTRRRLILVGTIASLVTWLAPVATLAADAERRLTPIRRPSPSGTSATRCAACGADDHAMLHPACPAQRKLRS